MRNFKFISTFCALLMAAVVATAAERTILLGPKTIGAGWKDNIVIQPQQFATTQVGDILTVYVDEVKGGAQGCVPRPCRLAGHWARICLLRRVRAFPP